MCSRGACSYCLPHNHFPPLQNPYIFPVLDVGISKDTKSVFVTRHWNPEGSLKDVIRNSANPKRAYHQKYLVGPASPKASKSPKIYGLSLEKIREYGCQILQGLSYLHSLNIPYYNLHCGNVMVVNGACRLSDLEDSFLGVSHQPCHELLKQYKSTDPRVGAFGLLLYEMATGSLPPTSERPKLNMLGSHDLNCLLESIFPQKNGKGIGFQELLKHRLFKCQASGRRVSFLGDSPLTSSKSMRKLCKEVHFYWQSVVYKGIKFLS